jgi:hypothetical protein
MTYIERLEQAEKFLWDKASELPHDNPIMRDVIRKSMQKAIREVFAQLKTELNTGFENWEDESRKQLARFNQEQLFWLVMRETSLGKL